MKRILTVIGARPQFIKASVVSRAIQKTQGIEETVLHTGQHYDANMSDIFFNQLDIPRPDIQLNIQSGSHGEMTGRMLIEIERALLETKPDRVLVYGDTNSTLSGALAAAKLHIPVAHVEAGLRSFNMKMPEEINRILTDQISDQLYCPTLTSVENLRNEGYAKKSAKVIMVGDVMQDAALLFAEKAVAPKVENVPENFILATIHRAENTDQQERLTEIVNALNYCHSELAPVILPLHPRTRKKITELGLELNVQVIEPVGYLQMLWLLNEAKLVLTDSGGVQKEAYFFGVPCVTLRDQTEWTELIEAGANKLVGSDYSEIIKASSESYGNTIRDDDQLYGGGKAADRIVHELLSS